MRTKSKWWRNLHRATHHRTHNGAMYNTWPQGTKQDYEE